MKIAICVGISPTAGIRKLGRLHTERMSLATTCGQLAARTQRADVITLPDEPRNPSIGRSQCLGSGQSATVLAGLTVTLRQVREADLDAPRRAASPGVAPDVAGLDRDGRELCPVLGDEPIQVEGAQRLTAPAGVARRGIDGDATLPRDRR